jgi:hypothetical protein
MAHCARFRTRLVTAVAVFALGCGPLSATALQPQQVPGTTGLDLAPAGTIAGELLQQARTVQKPSKKFGPAFNTQIKDLDKQSVKLCGFMMPLDQSEKQSRFLLSPFPPYRAFCMPGGPESLVEVVATTPVKFTWEAIVVSGKMNVFENDIVYYRLTDAQSVKF